jgi:predicted transcriptional regulator
MKHIFNIIASITLGLFLTGCATVGASKLLIPTVHEMQQSQDRIDQLIAEANDMAMGAVLQMQVPGLLTEEEEAALIAFVSVMNFDASAMTIALSMHDMERFNQYAERIQASIEYMSAILGPKVEKLLDAYEKSGKENSI